MSLSCLTQKVELNYLIPAIRKELIAFLEKQGLNDAEISRRLNITRAAVSQYKHKKRGKKIKFPEKIENKIKKAASAIMKGKNADAETNKIISLMKNSKNICIICGRKCE